MPIYEYECRKCHEVFEVAQKFSDQPLKRHNGPSRCGGKVVKLMSMNSFHLKGGGWYKTDYADKDKKKDVAEKTGTASDSKPESKTESKPAATSPDGGSAKPEKKIAATAGSATAD